MRVSEEASPDIKSVEPIKQKRTTPSKSMIYCTEGKSLNQMLQSAN